MWEIGCSGLLHLVWHVWSLRSLIFIFGVYFLLTKSLLAEKLALWEVSLSIDLHSLYWKVGCQSYCCYGESNMPFLLCDCSVIVIFVLLALNFHNMTMIFLDFLYIFPIQDLLSFLNLWIDFFCQVWKIPGYYFFKCCLPPNSLFSIHLRLSYTYVRTFILHPSPELANVNIE